MSRHAEVCEGDHSSGRGLDLGGMAAWVVIDEAEGVAWLPAGTRAGVLPYPISFALSEAPATMLPRPLDTFWPNVGTGVSSRKGPREAHGPQADSLKPCSTFIHLFIHCCRSSMLCALCRPSSSVVISLSVILVRRPTSDTIP
jgi:hypothetical protein